LQVTHPPFVFGVLVLVSLFLPSSPWEPELDAADMVKKDYILNKNTHAHNGNNEHGGRACSENLV
jgi:hypothetical protein